MSVLNIEGLTDAEKSRLVEEVFEDNVDFLCNKLDAGTYVNALRQKRSLRPEHAEEINNPYLTSSKKAAVIISALRKSEEPLRALINLIDVINDKGYQPHISRVLVKSFDEKKRALRQSKGLPGLLQLSSGSQAIPPLSTSYEVPVRPATAYSTVSAMESVGFDADAQGLVGPVSSRKPQVEKYPSMNSHSNLKIMDPVISGTYPPPPDLPKNNEIECSEDGPYPPNPPPLLHREETAAYCDPVHGPYPPSHPEMEEDTPTVHSDSPSLQDVQIGDTGSQGVAYNEMEGPQSTFVIHRPPSGVPVPLKAANHTDTTSSDDTEEQQLNYIHKMADNISASTGDLMQENFDLRDENRQLRARLELLDKELQIYKTQLRGGCK